MKSKVHISRSVPNKQGTLQAFGMLEENLPIKYLGVPLSSDYVNASQCVTLMQRMTTKLEIG